MDVISGPRKSTTRKEIVYYVKVIFGVAVVNGQVKVLPLNADVKFAYRIFQIVNLQLYKVKSNSNKLTHQTPAVEFKNSATVNDGPLLT